MGHPRGRVIGRRRQPPWSRVCFNGLKLAARARPQPTGPHPCGHSQPMPGLEGQERTRPLTSETAMPATIARRLVTLADAADALAVSTRTVRRYIADGQLEAVRLGRKTLRIKADSIERFVDAKLVGNWR